MNLKKLSVSLTDIFLSISSENTQAINQHGRNFNTSVNIVSRGFKIYKKWKKMSFYYKI